MANAATYNHTKQHYAEGSAPSTPDSGEVVVYAKTDGKMYSKDDAGTETLMSVGTALSNPMTTEGDLIVGEASGVPDRLAAGAAGTVLTSAGTSTIPTYDFPPGYEFAYAEATSNVNITATTDAGTNVVTTGSVSYDGTAVMIEAYAHDVKPDSGSAGNNIKMLLYMDSTLLGWWGFIRTPAASNMNVSFFGRRKYTPSAGSHTFSLKAYVNTGTGVVSAGSGGSDELPCYIRVTKA